MDTAPSVRRWVALRRAFVLFSGGSGSFSAAEAIESAALAFQSVHHIHGSDRLALGVFRVGDRVPDHILQENLQHPAGLLVDQTRDPLDAATASQTADGRFGDALDVITEHFTVPLGSAFAQSFASFPSARHDAASLRSLLSDKPTAAVSFYTQRPDLPEKRAERQRRGGEETESE